MNFFNQQDVLDVVKLKVGTELLLGVRPEHLVPCLKNDAWLVGNLDLIENLGCLLYTSPSPRDVEESRMPSSA